MNRHERRKQHRAAQRGRTTPPPLFVRSPAEIPPLPPGTLALPDEEIQARIAYATHTAVCMGTGSDGAQLCLFYAVIGATLAAHLLKRDYRPVMGTLWLHPDIDDYPAVFEIQSHPETGEFHAYVICVDDTRRITEIADFSARHYRTLTDRNHVVEGERTPWTRPDPPDYLWYRPHDMPDWAQLQPDFPANDFIIRFVTKEAKAIREMCRSAKELYQQATAGRHLTIFAPPVMGGQD